MAFKTHFDSAADVDAYFAAQIELSREPRPQPPDTLWEDMERALLLNAQFAKTRRRARRNQLLELSKAPFDIHDATLNSEMGACDTCPYRSGNAPGLFPDPKERDTCTAPPCFTKKARAAVERKIEQLAKGA